MKPGVLIDEEHSSKLHLGTARRHGLLVGDVHRPGAAPVYGDDAVDELAGTARFDWAALDSWFEEDEEVLRPSRSP